MDKKQYQATFKLAQELTSSSPAGLHYTNWKTMAKSNYREEFQCVMLSLPYIYRFVREQCLQGIDVMMKRKRGYLGQIRHSWPLIIGRGRCTKRRLIITKRLCMWLPAANLWDLLIIACSWNLLLFPLRLIFEKYLFVTRLRLFQNTTFAQFI